MTFKGAQGGEVGHGTTVKGGGGMGVAHRDRSGTGLHESGVFFGCGGMRRRGNPWGTG